MSLSLNPHKNLFADRQNWSEQYRQNFTQEQVLDIARNADMPMEGDDAFIGKRAKIFLASTENMLGSISVKHVLDFAQLRGDTPRDIRRYCEPGATASVMESDCGLDAEIGRSLATALINRFNQSFAETHPGAEAKLKKAALATAKL